MTVSPDAHTGFEKPVVAYTAATNLDAHVIVRMLEANGVPAFVIEDQSGVSLWMLGTISQFHQPRIWVEEALAEQAKELIRAFEEKNVTRSHREGSGGSLATECEQCGHTTVFPDSMNGTTQDCGHCGGFVDVGESTPDEDFGVAEDA